MFAKPAGNFIMMSMVFCLPACFLALGGLVGGAPAGMRGCDNLMMFCVADVALGLMHIGFWIYFQQRLISGLEAKGQGLASNNMMNEAAQIVMWDFGFCLYIFVYFGSFGFNVWGFGTASCNTCALFAAIIMVLYGFAGMGFMMLWFCALACEDCMGSWMGNKGSTQTKNTGLTRFVFGQTYGQPAQQQMGGGGYHGGGQPAPVVQGQVIGGQGGGGGCGGGAYTGGSPQVPPRQQPTAGQQAASVGAQVAGGAIGMAGQGLTAVGGWLQKQGQKK
jgi:hypothetical protein